MNNINQMTTTKKFTASITDVGNCRVAFFTDEDGNDWYAMQKKFSADTLKIMFDDKGAIISYAWDVSMLAPDNLSVAEVEKIDIPNDFFESDLNWCFDGEGISLVKSSDEEVALHNQSKKEKLLTAAALIIEPLHDAIDLDIATNDEIERLKEWKEYRVKLNRVNVKEPKWPDIPL